MIEPAALLFDMDGLMIDSEPLWFEVEVDFARARGGRWTLDDARAGVGGGLRRTAVRLAERLGLAQAPEVGVAELVERFEGRLGDLALKRGLLELVAAARDARLPIAVASSNVRALVAPILARFDLARRFDAVVCGDDVAHPKPAPDVFLEAARRLGVAPAGCVVLEDALAGARAGKAAGMTVIAVPEHWPADGFADVAAHIVKDLYEARALLRLPGDPPGGRPAPA